MPWNHTLEVQFVFAIEPRTQSNVCKFESEIVYLVQKQYNFRLQISVDDCGDFMQIDEHL